MGYILYCTFFIDFAGEVFIGFYSQNSDSYLFVFWFVLLFVLTACFFCFLFVVFVLFLFPFLVLSLLSDAPSTSDSCYAGSMLTFQRDHGIREIGESGR